MTEVETFTVTAAHLALLRGTHVEWNDAQSGAPMIDPKRPYGTKNVAESVAAITGDAGYAAAAAADNASGEDDATEEYIEIHWDRFQQLHRETETALQIVLDTASFEPGEYVRVRYSGRWRRLTSGATPES